MQLFNGRPAIVPPRWVPWTTTVLCLIGVADATYLTIAHYTSATILSCPSHGPICCSCVTTSAESHFLGMPVAVLGLAWVVGMLVLCSPPAWRATSIWVSRVRLLGSVTGVAMILWLIYAELFDIDHICEYCTVMHIITFALFVVIGVGTVNAVPGDLAEDELSTEGLSATIA